MERSFVTIMYKWVCAYIVPKRVGISRSEANQRVEFKMQETWLCVYINDGR